MQFRKRQYLILFESYRGGYQYAVFFPYAPQTLIEALSALLREVQKGNRAGPVLRADDHRVRDHFPPDREDDHQPGGGGLHPDHHLLGADAGRGVFAAAGD